MSILLVNKYDSLNKPATISLFQLELAIELAIRESGRKDVYAWGQKCIDQIGISCDVT